MHSGRTAGNVLAMTTSATLTRTPPAGAGRTVSDGQISLRVYRSERQILLSRLEHTRAATPGTHKPPQDGPNVLPLSEIVGDDFVAEVAASNSTNGPRSLFTKDDLLRVQSEIACTMRPSHSTGPPARIGTKVHGKLKADQWKAGIDFELPVYLMKHCHHNAMHIPEFLMHFGPMPGWWMFPFERVIGLLQQVNTNGKIGQMDRTMLDTFCAAANIKSFVQQEACPDALQRLRPLMESLLKADTRATVAGDEISNYLKFKELDKHYYEAMVSQQTAIKVDLPDWTPGRRAIMHNRYTFSGLTYSKYVEGKAGGIIFFQPRTGDAFIPGVIREIFAVAALDNSRPHLVGHMLLAVQRFQPRPPSVVDPFLAYPDFGASIWSRTTSRTMEIIPVVRELHHAIVQPWDDGTYVLKSTATAHNRLLIDYFECNYVEVLRYPSRGRRELGAPGPTGPRTGCHTARRRLPRLCTCPKRTQDRLSGPKVLLFLSIHHVANALLSVAKRYYKRCNARRQTKMFDPATETVVLSDRPKIRKPDGEVARPGRGGYTLASDLKWPDGLYGKVQHRVAALATKHMKPISLSNQPLEAIKTVCDEAAKSFPVLLDYEDHWVTRDMLKTHLKNKAQRAK
ncbi:uncharacterized protein B0H18DRAFT_960738 [Fomitopsis serialis]|uniref:uncharacterized protein n=1 Tax=Fomitopsis serialis TaxID=139415 RepID=UPI002008C154|nr:uncharacterized protein B0H18DRAFT_960738 [Neoantrodia serialis]KAH9912870.1 hypothetical protein B0H18DRAFT_960738 [Neoantrodia serialis]